MAERLTGVVVNLRGNAGRVRIDGLLDELDFMSDGLRPGDRVSFVPYQGVKSLLAADVRKIAGGGDGPTRFERKFQPFERRARK